MEPRYVRTRRSSRSGALGASLILTVSAATVLAQAPAPGTPQPPPWQRVLRGDDAKRVEALEKAIGDLEKKGQFAEAVAPAREVLAVRGRAQGEDHWETVSARINEQTCTRLAGLPRGDQSDLAAAIRRTEEATELHQKGRYAEAEPLLRGVREVFRRVLGKDHLGTASCDHILAGNLYAQGKYAEAQSLFQTALVVSLRTAGEDHPDTVQSYIGLASSLYAQGKYAEAQTVFERALAISSRTRGEDDAETGTSCNSLAVTLNAQGKYAEAQPWLEKALAIIRRNLREDHLETARSYHNLAYNLHGQGKYAEADALYRKALAIWRGQLGEDHPKTAVTYNNLAINLHDSGKYAEAELIFERALRCQRDKLGEDHPDTALTYRSLAVNRNAQGKYAEAEATALAAARSYEAARLRISLAGLQRAEFASKGSPLAVLAALLARRGRGQDAWIRWEAELARGLFDDLAVRRSQTLTPDERRRCDELTGQLNRLDNQISALAGTRTLADDQRKRLDEIRGRRLELQGRLVELEAELVRKYRVAAGAVYAIDAIQAQLPADAALVGWLDLKTRPGAADPQGDHWACVVRRRGAPRWVRIVGTGPGRAWTRDDDQRLDQARSILAGADRRAWRESLAALATQRLAPLEPALRAGDDGPAVRHLIVLPSSAMSGIPVEVLCAARAPAAPRYVVSYAPSGTVFAWLGERRREDDRPARSRRLLALGDPVPPAAGESTTPTPRPPDQGLLVQQVVAGSNAEQAGIRPGDVLLRYDGAALAARADLQKRVEAGDSRASGVAVAVWRDGRTFDRTLRPGPLGVVLNDRPAAEAILARREADALLRRTRGAAFARLPGSRREVQAIAGLFDRAAVYLGSDASEQTLESLRARGELASFAVIHLATHGEIDDLSPMNSRLLLAQDRLPDPTAGSPPDGPAYDGTLTAGEVLSVWKLDADLVTLSACRSGLGRQGGGEGYIGFAQAFFLAGARSLVVSLWEVDDRATSLLMTRFYQNWLGNRPGLTRPLSKAEALREARAWLRDLTGSDAESELRALARGELRPSSTRPPTDHPFAHPHDWAGFILIGDPE